MPDGTDTGEIEYDLIRSDRIEYLDVFSRDVGLQVDPAKSSTS